MSKYKHPAPEKTYHGVHPCTLHDFITEMLKLAPDTLCKKCYTTLAKTQIQQIAAVMVQQYLIKEKYREIYEFMDSNKTKIDATMQAFSEYQAEMEERLNELSTAQGPAALTVLQATYLSEAKLFRKQLQAITDLFKKIDPDIDTKAIEGAAAIAPDPEIEIVPAAGNNDKPQKDSRD